MDDHAAATDFTADHRSDLPTHQLDVQEWYCRVYALCRSRLLSPSDAEDATQETFLRGIEGLKDLRSTEAIGGWLRKIAHNVCIDMIRRQKVRKTCVADVQDLSGGANSEPSSRDQREHLIDLIEALPQSLREIVLLHYYEEMTYDEMAQWLNVARSTVNERLSKARHLLKQQLVSTENAP